MDDEPEWLEIHNLENRTRILTNGWISDKSRAVQVTEIRIPAKGYAVLCRDTMLLKQYWRIPPDAVVIETPLPSLNNAGDVLVLKNSDSLTLDSILYKMPSGRKGISLERLNADSSGTTAGNWDLSQDFQRATPGYLNSITLVDYDFRIIDFSVNNIHKHIQLRCINNGKNPIDSGVVQIYFFQSTHNKSLVFSQTFHNLQPGDTVTALLSQSSFPYNWQRFQALISSPIDFRQTNDTLTKPLYISHPPSTIVFNEILYEPEGNCGEFIEIWNAASDTVELGGFTIIDSSESGIGDTIHIPAIDLPPQQLAVIVWDTSCFYARFPDLRDSAYVIIPHGKITLNNSGDHLKLYDPNFILQDSLTFKPSWHLPQLRDTRNRSLEKITPSLPSHRPDSWTSSGATAGSTPHAPNSITIVPEHRGTVSATPNPFVADPRSFTTGCVLSYRLPFTQSLLTIKIFDPNGIEVKNLAQSFYTASYGELRWDGTDNGNKTLPPGPYIAVVEAMDISTGRLYRTKLLIVISPQ